MFKHRKAGTDENIPDYIMEDEDRKLIIKK